MTGHYEQKVNIMEYTIYRYISWSSINKYNGVFIEHAVGERAKPRVEWLNQQYPTGCPCMVVAMQERVSVTEPAGPKGRHFILPCKGRHPCYPSC